MKETVSMILLFTLTGVFSGALKTTALVVLLIISTGLIYVAWSAEKKEKKRTSELKMMRKERQDVKQPQGAPKDLAINHYN